jgi:ubiquinone biosynthesis protein
MPNVSVIEAGLGRSATERVRTALADLLSGNGTRAERISAIQGALLSPAGRSLRDTMARWIVEALVPVEKLVPAPYIKWREPVRDAMTFVVARLSPSRLAPKLLEQLELPDNTPAEARLLRLISKVPGLQKLGQVIARNRHLRPALRNALARLENGIRDVQPQEIRAIIQRDLGPSLDTFEVTIARAILSEASVSAVVRFTWRNPATGRRERGVFKVLKPHIQEYFAEDMDYLHGLAQYFGAQHPKYGFPPEILPDTFNKVRRLLQHEVDFVREQRTLKEAWDLYRNVSGVRVPRVIEPLCTARITALTEERGIKVTNAAARLPAARRRRIAQQLIEALVAVPLLSSREDAIFHGDPHSGNLLYNSRTGELTIIDWALRERLSRDQRRHLVRLFLLVGLRDPVGTCNEVLALSQQHIRRNSTRGRMISGTVTNFLDQMPLLHIPTGVDAMRLLERIALKGVKFPAPLIMLSKVMFTLEGILDDIGGSSRGMNLTIAGHLARHWFSDCEAFRSPLATRDFITLPCSTLLYMARLLLRAELTILNRLLPSASSPPLSTA